MSLDESQESKYDIQDGRLVNRETGKEIPADEPVFVLRAKDFKAIATLQFYLGVCTKPDHRSAISDVIKRFKLFRKDNPDLMKEPDSAPGKESGEPTITKHKKPPKKKKKPVIKSGEPVADDPTADDPTDELDPAALLQEIVSETNGSLKL